MLDVIQTPVERLLPGMVPARNRLGAVLLEMLCMLMMTSGL